MSNNLEIQDNDIHTQCNSQNITHNTVHKLYMAPNDSTYHQIQHVLTKSQSDDTHHSCKLLNTAVRLWPIVDKLQINVTKSPLDKLRKQLSFHLHERNKRPQ